MKKHLEIFDKLFERDCDAHIVHSQDGKCHCEFGGQLPFDIVYDLCKLGADVHIYSQRGVISTVVTF